MTVANKVVCLSELIKLVIQMTEQKYCGELHSLASYLWQTSSSFFVSSPGFGQRRVVLLGMGRACPVCTCCPWSPERGAVGCRSCWQLWAEVEGSCKSPGWPRRRWSCCPARTRPVRSGGCRPGCSGTSCCVCPCDLLVFRSDKRAKQSSVGSFWTPAGEMIIKSGWHQLCWGRSCWSSAGAFVVLRLS